MKNFIFCAERIKFNHVKFTEKCDLKMAKKQPSRGVLKKRCSENMQ